jgi:DNA polymerase-3 subunit beta
MTTSTLTRLAFTVEAKPLAAAAAWAARHIPAKPTPAILGGILIEADGLGTVSLSGFDYDTYAVADLTIETAPDPCPPGQALVSGRLFADLVKTLPAKPVVAEMDDHALTLRCGTVRLTLPLMVIEDYPDRPPATPVIGRVDAQAFARMCEQVCVYADQRGDTHLMALTGVHLTFGAESITALASNTYRGAIGHVEWEPAGPGATDVSALVPAEVLAELARATEPPGVITIGLSDGMISFTDASRGVVSRLIDPKDFPARNLSRVAPTRGGDPSVVNVAALIESLKRAARVLPPKDAVRLVFTENAVTVTGTDESGEVDNTLDCRHRAFEDEAPAEVLINPTYLSDGLAVLGTAEVELTLPSAGKRAILLTMPGDDTYRAFIMPIRKG